MKSAWGQSDTMMNMAQQPDRLFQTFREIRPKGPCELGITAEEISSKVAVWMVNCFFHVIISSVCSALLCGKENNGKWWKWDNLSSIISISHKHTHTHSWWQLNLVFNVEMSHFNTPVLLYVHAGVGGNLVAIQASRMSTYLHYWSVPGALPFKMSGSCPGPCATFCSSGQMLHIYITRSAMPAIEMWTWQNSFCYWEVLYSLYIVPSACFDI